MTSLHTVSFKKTKHGEEDNEDEGGGEQHHVQEDASGGGEPEATWHSTANPNTTV